MDSLKYSHPELEISTDYFIKHHDSELSNCMTIDDVKRLVSHICARHSKALNLIYRHQNCVRKKLALYDFTINVQLLIPHIVDDLTMYCSIKGYLDEDPSRKYCDRQSHSIHNIGR